MDPAICIEAAEAQQSQCAADAEKTVAEAARQLSRQHEIIREIESGGNSTTAAKRELAGLAAIHQLSEEHHKSWLQRRSLALVDS
jgi:hypothetical protein